MIKMTLSEMAKHLDGATITQDAECVGLSRDTRSLTKKNLYVAIRGENFDGHNFVVDAHKKHAAAALVDHPIDCPIPQIIVKDTIAALGKIAAAWRSQFNIPFIGVTGSNGKTTLKNMIASILRAATGSETKVLATEGNLNNNIGVPLMLARLDDKHRYSVIEMGMNHPGEIDYLTHLVKPHVAVVNNAAAAHLEGLGDIAGVARAKGEIFGGLDKDGIAILNRDDAFYDYWEKLTAQHNHITFGLQHATDVYATFSDDSTITLYTPNGEVDVTLPLLGKHNVMNALAATAATIALDINLAVIKKGLEAVKPAPGRLQLHVLANGVRIIDDTYNANPASMTAAIHALAEMSGTKILVLGDMKELGVDAKALHAEIGKKAFDAGINYLFTFGELTKETTKAFGKDAEHFTDRDELVKALQKHLKKGSIILIKGSRSMTMEKIVAKLLPNYEHTH